MRWPKHRTRHKKAVLLELHCIMGTQWERYGFADEFVRMNVPYDEVAQFNLAIGDNGPTDYLQFKIHRLDRKGRVKR